MTRTRYLLYVHIQGIQLKMSVHAAVADLLRQPLSTVGVSSLSSVIEALNDAHVLAALISPAHRNTLLAVLQRMVTMANDGTRNTASRIMNLEILYRISSAADDALRQGVLFVAVQQLDDSFDAMMTPPHGMASGGRANWGSRTGGADVDDDGDEVMEAPRRMLVVLLLRCTGYTRLTAGDLLRQVCGGSDERLLTLLSSIIQHSEYEDDLVLAVVRFLYELTTPSSYFDADTVEEDRRVDAFVAKMHRLSDTLTKSDMIVNLLNELTVRYSKYSNIGHAGDEMMAHGGGGGSAAHDSEKLWRDMMRLLATFLQNLVEFSSKYAKVAEFQRSMYTRADNFLTTVAIPFIKTTLQSWAHLIEHTGAQDVASAHNRGRQMTSSSLTLLSSALVTMRLIRFVLYNHAHDTPSMSLQRGLIALTQFMSHEEPLLRNEYVGLLIMVTLLDCLCNVNAVKLVAPVNVAAALSAFLDVVANDASPMPQDRSCTAAEGLALCFINIDSLFRASTNETTVEINRRLHVEELQHRADAEVISIMQQFEEQLTVLQAVIAQIGFGDLLSELNLGGDYDWDCNLTGQRRRSSLDAQACGRATGHSSEKSSRQRRSSRHEEKKGGASRDKRHPAKYCCQLTGHLMREPVTLQNGNHYEYKALMEVIDKIGHVDPLTNESINETIEVNELLQEELARYRVKLVSRK